MCTGDSHLSAYFIMRKEVGGVVNEFRPQGDEEGVRQREPKKRAGGWQWNMHVGRAEDAAWKMIGGWQFGTKRRNSRSNPERGKGRCKEESWKMPCGG